jgi:hypothetical protein
VAEQVIMEATSAVNPDFVVTFQEPFALHTQEYVQVQPLVWHVLSRCDCGLPCVTCLRNLVSVRYYNKRALDVLHDMDVPTYLRFVRRLADAWRGYKPPCSPMLCAHVKVALVPCEPVQVEHEVKEEDTRCRSYLPDPTRVVLLNTCRKVFLAYHSATIVNR